MAGVTQTIPTYTGGISQQPDELKIPGQVNKAKNVIPDVTDGLTKRPGGKLVASLSDSSNFSLPDGSNSTTTYDPDSQTNGKWLSYYRDESEQYIGQIDRTGNVRMWQCSTFNGVAAGSPVPVLYTPIPWKTATVYGIGDIISANDKIYSAKTAGTSSGSTAPSHSSGDATVGGNTWTYEGTTADRTTALKLYLNHYADDDLQSLTLNDYTYVSNRAKYKSDGTTAHPKTTVVMKALTPGEYNSDLTVTADKNKNAVRPNEGFINLKKIQYASQYALNLFDSTQGASSTISTATRIKVERDIDSKNACTSGNVLPSSGNLPDDGNFCNDSAGNDQDAYCPNVETRIFSISSNDAGPPADANGTAQSYAVTRSGSTIATGAAANLYFRIATIGQSVAQGGSQAEPDYQCRYTTTHDLLYGGEGWETDDFFYVWMKNARYKITIEDHSVSKIQVTMNNQAGSGAIRPLPTPFDNQTTITAESILGEIRTIIEGYNNGIDASETKQIGTGLYLTNGTAFNVSTPNGDLMTTFSRNVNTIEDLPMECLHGYAVKVKNSDADEDDYWVKFLGENNSDGPGVWEECPEPGRKINFDEETMPIQIVRKQDDGSGTRTGTANRIFFEISHPDWSKCQVGDTATNPEPSFVGNKISQLVFFRNRLCILSDTNIVMSRPGNFFNFWGKSAITYSNTDPIDLSVSSTFPSIIYSGIQVNSGLVLFTANQQFMLTTDSDILNPTTAKINAIADYNFNYKTNPQSLGTSVGFLDNAGKYTRFFEMAGIRREGEPKVIEQSKVVSKLFDADLSVVSSSRENGIMLFNEKNKSTIYGFRYFNASQKRLQQAWFTWEMSGNVQYQCMLDDSFYAIIRNGSKDVMQKFDIKMRTDSRTVTDDFDTTDTTDDVTYRIHLDNSSIVGSGSISYNATTNKTTFALPTGFNNSSAQLAVYVLATGTDDRFEGMTNNATLNGSTVELPGNWKTYDIENPINLTDGAIRTGTTVTITYASHPFKVGDALQLTFEAAGITDGNYTVATVTDNTFTVTDSASGTVSAADVTVKSTQTPGNDFILGYQFDMEVEFPTIHITRTEGEATRSETRGSLIIHRAKLSLGDSGQYTAILKRLGKDDFSETYEPPSANAYNANQVGVIDESIRTIPIYDRNTNATLTLKSTHPSPATLQSMTWEGEYTTKFYQRV